MNNKLKSCPFCGSEVEFSPASPDDKTRGLFICTNKDCYARVDWYDVKSHSTVEYERAVELWNRRANE